MCVLPYHTPCISSPWLFPYHTYDAVPRCLRRFLSVLLAQLGIKERRPVLLMTRAADDLRKFLDGLRPRLPPIRSKALGKERTQASLLLRDLQKNKISYIVEPLT